MLWKKGKSILVSQRQRMPKVWLRKSSEKTHSSETPTQGKDVGLNSEAGEVRWLTQDPSSVFQTHEKRLGVVVCM